ncbi:crossover junction endodeoxyribonuclease RuvC [Anaerosalibacter bizertensis]|uniref:Crossover junction endodeoxyribonuclease RuvC n=1 Tax=Anaerosalibacter bizertensis TaxID=932217 RepID=A0A844FJ67_9FIRM|nr:crossover junction endodeoxyribonuclease RuvC [Anaerosalibacter bizertensis]MBU5293410.1 crossover junction endodeoxyribonuclease RuvC [Anaerosalibacter bizertensis]MSS44137.1 crossover junction endodeoxyribonuclease RuvC [Anaerosalibacter bizertensis]HHV27776.1 crossover junction endodeoxyribonuclease RuvC [Tissierellia bacterium]
MIILGIDPGIAIVGYGVIECKGNRFKALDYGAITTEANIPFTERIRIIYDDMTTLIDKYNPTDLAIEELFFNKNVKTAIKVGQARGVEILAAVHKGLNIYEYTPLQVKQGVVGYGRAEKRQVQEMVKMLLNLKEIPKPDDAADALALALCHGSSLKFKEMFRMK